MVLGIAAAPTLKTAEACERGLPPGVKTTMTRAKGIGLLSGGLDSALACVVLRDAGADVKCLHFFSGFCVTGHNARVGRTDRPVVNHALQVAAEIGVPIELVDISAEYLPIVLQPKHGYGRNMNPCIDCRIFMLRKARERMERTGADFVFTGEVAGQRPKSQVKGALRAIERDAGLEGRLLRPLSAKLLPPTDVEKRGLVDRERLFGLSGRGRKPQLEMAARYGLKAYTQPAGGCCFLTDKAYSGKFKDIIEHRGPENLTVDDVFVLGVGRHFRLSQGLRIIVGRNAAENDFLSRHAADHWSAGAIGFTGPRAIVLGDVGEDDWRTIASIVARYSDGRNEGMIDVEFVRGVGVKRVSTEPASEEVLDRCRI
jgi:tRNA U34 2-thiouridine synthase MnmA/TrmU